YFNEFCYRINRSQNKETIFNNLIRRMVAADNITHQQLISS
ncbi:MAG: IS1595 family transposase, partial [Bacteroidales bacterium]|nr:IS1595 family transposase [Bacteroidales bacterium]MCF8369661.1 IS1595 family transposase [Bacteroidales bacterium]MCF8369757.1 IS1595 family transposase [Bacteroidales bacterium]MCF8369804.1 IS1595 family transposase [Bacteroidales bacterium]MCF8369893.1 IS1595 family transposase [Bacteroidales bacterium]